MPNSNLKENTIKENTKENDKSDKSGYSTISIPKPLADKIKKRCEGTGFNSLSGYVTYVLRQVISNIEDKEKTTKQPQEAFSQDEERKVKERLRSLGYLD